jgi:ribosomal-protein-serine acetyltransferase
MFQHPIAPNATLRLLELRHAAELFTLCDNSREHLSRFLPWIDRTHSVAEPADFIRRSLRQFADNLGFHAGIWLGDSLAGCIGIHPIDWDNLSTSIGYWIAPQHEGKGLMTAACREVIGICFDQYKLNRIEIRCAVTNTRSCAIPRRLGFQEEGVVRAAQRIRDGYLDLRIFSLLRSDKRI